MNIPTEKPMFKRVGFDLDSRKSWDVQWRVARLMDIAVSMNCDLYSFETRNGYHFKLYLPQAVDLQEDMAIRAPYDSPGRLYWEDIRRGWVKRTSLKFLNQFHDILHSFKLYPSGRIGVEEKEIHIVESGKVNPKTEKHLREIGMLRREDERFEPTVRP